MSRSRFYDTYPLNTFWQKINLPAMIDILNSSSNDLDALGRIQKTYFFQISIGGRLAEKTVDWHLRSLERRNDGLSDMVSQVQESELTPDIIVVRRGTRRFSVDIFRVANIAFNILHFCNLDASGRHTFFELGAGLGYLARFLKRVVPGGKYIICDLPISLCYSFLFLSRSFPEQKMLLVTSNEDLKAGLFDHYDVIFAAPCHMDGLKKYGADVFINTCSLGEMNNSVSKLWFDFVQNDLNPRYFYSLNRFLNRIDNSAEYKWRESENGCSFYYDKRWDVLRFQAEDERFFGPYMSTIHPRYLEMILQRAPAAHGDNSATSSEAVESLLCQDWMALYDQSSWAINYRGPNMANDFSINGLLFKYWNNVRLSSDVLSYLVFLGYLDFMNLGNRLYFEESVFIEDQLTNLSTTLRADLKEKLVSFVESRRSARRSADGAALKSKNAPNSIKNIIDAFLA